MTNKQRWLLAVLADLAHETDLTIREEFVAVDRDGRVYIRRKRSEDAVELTEDGIYRGERMILDNPLVVRRYDSIIREQARDVIYHIIRETGDQLMGVSR